MLVCCFEHILGIPALRTALMYNGLCHQEPTLLLLCLKSHSQRHLNLLLA